MKSKYAGLLPLTSTFNVKYTPKEYDVLPEEMRPVFILSPWNNKEVKNLSNIGSNDNAAMESLRKKINGWSNMINIDGEEIEYQSDTNGVLRSLLDQIPMKVLLEVLQEVSRISGLK